MQPGGRRGAIPALLLLLGRRPVYQIGPPLQSQLRAQCHAPQQADQIAQPSYPWRCGLAPPPPLLLLLLLLLAPVLASHRLPEGRISRAVHTPLILALAQAAFFRDRPRYQIGAPHTLRYARSRLGTCSGEHMRDAKTHRHTERQRDRQAGRQADADRHTEREGGRGGKSALAGKRYRSKASKSAFKIVGCRAGGSTSRPKVHTSTR